MRRYFNTEGQCDSDIHYMVRLDERLKKIRERYVERGSYFIINRGRQYGKTTTLTALAESLKEDYTVISLDFQKMGTVGFQNEFAFASAFVKMVMDVLKSNTKDDVRGMMRLLAYFIADEKNIALRELFLTMSQLCQIAEKPVVLLIDEVDSASNNQVFIDFLAMLRSYYLDRKNRATFYSVILAGVYDIKNLKLKIRSDDEHQYNSPWNIAAKFNIDMSFSGSQIASMLEEYEADNHTGMDIQEVSQCIYDYTSGYPYLVSVICKTLDEELSQNQEVLNGTDVWTRKGVAEAVKILLKENTPLFDSMVKQLDIYKDLRKMTEEILYQGKKIPFSMQVKSVNLGTMFGFLKEDKGCVSVSNRIFEMVLLNMFIAQEAMESTAFQRGECDKNQFIKNGRLNMKQVLERFVLHFSDIYGDNEQRFVEAYGRKFFLLYLKPIINGTGNYYVEAQTRDARRTDVVVDYLGEQFVVELKIWHGNEYNERGEKQLAEYLDYFRLEKGYMLSFNFNKKKEIGVKEIKVGNRTIVEAVV